MAACKHAYKQIIFVLAYGGACVTASTLPLTVYAEQQDSADLARSIFQQSIQSQSTSNAAKESGTVPKPSPTPAVTPTPTPTATNPSTIPTSSMPSINPSAQQGQQSQDSGGSANQAAGQALMAAGAALMSNPMTMPAGAALMAMGMLAMMQSGHDNNAAGQSNAAYNASAFGDTTNPNSVGPQSEDPTTPTSIDTPDGSAGFKPISVAQAEKKLEDAGYKMTAAGLVNPNGSVTPSSAFNSPGSMAAAGMSPQAVAEAKKVTDALNDEISKAKLGSLATDGGGGGGYSAGGGGDDGSGGGGLHLSRYHNPFAMNDAAKNKLVAGKTVMFDGEPIGVRGQNIFDMIHVAYDKQRTASVFIESDRDPNRGIAIRSPASQLPRFVPTSLPSMVPAGLPVKRK